MDLREKILQTARELEIEPVELSRKKYRKHGPGGADKGFSEARLKAQVAYVNDVGTPAGMYLQASTVHLDADGSLKQMWAKPRKGAEDLRAVEQHLRKLVKGFAPLAPTPAPDDTSAEELLAVYALGDHHIGSYARARVSGEDWSRAHAVAEGQRAIDALVAHGTPAHSAVLADVGDYLHVCNPENATVKGTRQDVDGLFYEALEDAYLLKVYMIQALLRRHQIVKVVSKDGNHPGRAAYGIQIAIAAHFRADPRVEVEINPAAVSYIEWGQCLLAITHGDTLKGKDIPGEVASQEPKAWGRTRYRRAIVGHVHHEDVKEYPGMTVEYVPCLTPEDAWHAGEGYRSQRAMHRILFHRDRGLVGRRVYAP